MDPMDLMTAGLTLVAGGAWGFWVRGRRHHGQIRRMDELYGRKVTLAENEREAAVRELNANRIEMNGYQERFDALDDQITGLQKELQATGNQLSSLDKDLVYSEDKRAESGRRISELEADLAVLQEAADTVDERHALVLAERDSARDEILEQKAEIARQLAEREAQLGERERELEDRATRIEALLEEVAGRDETLAAERGRKAELEAHLGSTREKLEAEVASTRQTLEAEVVRTRETLESELAGTRESLGAELVSTRTELEEQLAATRQELETSTDQCAELSARLAELEDLPRVVSERDQSLGQRDDRIAVLEERVSELEPFPEKLSALEGSSARERQELEAALERAGVEAEARETEKLELLARIEELEPLPAALESKEAELASQRGDYDELIKGLEEASQQELASAGETHRSAYAALEATLAATRQQAELLESQLGEERELHLATRERLEGSERSKVDLAKEMAEGKTHLANLSSSHKAVQLELGRTSKRGEDLETKLGKVREELTAVRAESRDRGVELKALAKELQKAERRAQSAEKRLVAAQKAAEAKLAKATKRAKAEKTIKPHKATKAAKPAKKAKKSRKPVEKDDLQVLPGVGPVLEKKLNRLGVRTYASLVELDKDELGVLADKVHITPQKIRKDRWIPIARREHKAKYGQKL